MYFVQEFYDCLRDWLYVTFHEWGENDEKEMRKWTFLLQYICYFVLLLILDVANVFYVRKLCIFWSIVLFLFFYSFGRMFGLEFGVFV